VANVLNGGLGNDTYYIGAGDTVIDSGGKDTVYATFKFSNAAIENIFVNSVAVKGGGTLVKGTSGSNSLVGSAGNDILSGGLGKDKLKGLGGNDVFLFNTAPGPANVDRIVDFSVADDTIQLSKAVFSHVQSSKGILKSSAFWKGKAAHDSNDHVIYDHVGGALYYDPDGKGGAAAIKIATLAAGLKMTAADFVLV
jgi:Ca2+-binding RTX toxin-like protein